MGTSGLRYADGLGSGGIDAVAISTAHEYRVLAVDDQAAVVTAVRRLLRSRGFHVEPCTDPQEALALLESDPHRYDLLMLDVSMPTMSGIEMLARIKELAPDLPVIMLTGDDRAQTAVAALKAGAFNYLTKPLSDPDTVALVLARAGHHGSLQRRARELEHKISLADRFPRMIGESAPMRDLFVRIEKLAQTNATVLIRGESGTGKELVAREIHERSSCGRGPYVALNCGAIPETLIDSELFGHVRGAFTGAIANKLGVFGEANQGTLFLDEIGELPVHVQPRLLRVLQEREVRPVGSNRARVVDVRVIAATHVDLDAAVENSEFRADLYYRLNVVTLHLPPLRERLDDLPILSRHLLHKHALRTNRERVPRFTPEAMDAMLHYGWPGNIRELENAVQHALALVPGEEIGLDLLPRRIAEGCPPPRSMVPRTRADAGVADDEMSFKEARKQAQDTFERTYLHRLLTRTQGNVSEAARLAGLDRSNFRRVLARHDIDPEIYRV